MFPKHTKNKILFLLAVFGFCLLTVCINSSINAAAYDGFGNNISLYNSNIKDISVKLSYEKKTWEYKYPEIIYNGKIDSELDKKFEKDFRGRIARQKAPVICSYKLINAEEKLKEIAFEIDTEAVNAEVTFTPDSVKKFDIKNDIPGKKTDIKKLLNKISKQLGEGKSVNLNIVPEVINAKYTAQSLKNSFNIRQQFYTEFASSSPERKHNIALSLKQFNGMIIPPGTEISFNKTVGRRTEENGYKMAKIIVGGDFVEGIGGGVCQTSTTLYNALILSDIKISEYHNHTLAVSYILPSFDAMVNISTSDLKFCNNSGNFIYIKTWTENNRAYVRIYGDNMDYKIERKSTVTKTYETPKEKLITDPEGIYKNIYEGEKTVVIHSKPKTESVGELLYYRNGKLFKTVKLRKDVYAQLVGKEVIGTSKRTDK